MLYKGDTNKQMGSDGIHEILSHTFPRSHLTDVNTEAN